MESDENHGFVILVVNLRD